MSCESSVYSFQEVVFAASGNGITWRLSKNASKALEAYAAANDAIYTESQLIALEKKKETDIACGEIETAHPGYLGSQDTFFVGTLKGVGRVYQQTFVDTYSKIAHCTPLQTLESGKEICKEKQIV